MNPNEWQANSGEQPYAESDQNKQNRPHRPRFQNQGNNYHRTNDGARQQGYQREGYRRDGYQRDNRDGYQRDNREGYQREGGYRRDNTQRDGYRRQNDSNEGFRPRNNYGERRHGDNEGNGGFRPQQRRQGNNFRNNNRGNNNRRYNPTRQINYEEPAYDPSKPMRLNKFLANAGICSRREADEFIQAGVISVNGNVVTELGTKITGADRVMFHDQMIQMERKVYILLNKPKDCVTTAEDTHARTTVLDIIKGACRERVYPVGRLDRNTTGVLLLTNDGELATKLTHPKYNKKKIYHVKLDRELAEEDRELLLKGIELEPDTVIAADALEYVKDEDKTQVGIEIHSGQNRVVRRMFEKLNYKVIKLDRVLFAGLTKKNLARGKWRFLTQREVNMLQMGAFE